MKPVLKKIFALLLTALILIPVLAACDKKDDLGVTPEDPLAKKEQTVSYKTFENAGFYYLSYLQVPDNWYYEENDNGFTFIENRTGTEIGFIISDYYPTIHNIDYDYAQSLLNTDTTSFVSFQKPAGNQLFFKYYLNVNGLPHATCEAQKFNYKYVYTLRLICEERLYDDFYPIFETVYNSMTLSPEILTVPDGYNGIYHNNFKLLTVYPREWKTTIGADYYTTAFSGSSITMTFSKPIANFAGMDKTTYNGVMQQTVQNFSTSAFANSNGVIMAEGYYTADSVRYLVYNKIYNFKDYSLNIIYVAPENESASYIGVYQMLLEHMSTQ